MLTAIKTKAKQKINLTVLEEIKKLKTQFGIEEHYLEKLMEISM